MTTSPILVLGATGTVGSHLVRQLAAKGEAVKAATRDPSRAPSIAGVVPTRFDYAEPATFEAALEGVERVFVLTPPNQPDAAALAAPFLERAFKSVRKVVAMTAQGVEHADDFPLRRLERQIEASGLAYVHLRPNWFSDNFHTSWLPSIASDGVIALPAADSRTAFIDTRDIAAAAVGALTSSAHDGQAVALTGPAALTYAQAASALSEAAGRPIRYLPLDDDTFRAGLLQAGLDDAYADLLLLLFSTVREGMASVVTDGVQALTGRAPRDLATYARDHAAAFRR